MGVGLWWETWAHLLQRASVLNAWGSCVISAPTLGSATWWNLKNRSAGRASELEVGLFCRGGIWSQCSQWLWFWRLDCAPVVAGSSKLHWQFVLRVSIVKTDSFSIAFCLGVASFTTVASSSLCLQGLCGVETFSCSNVCYWCSFFSVLHFGCCQDNSVQFKLHTVAVCVLLQMSWVRSLAGQVAVLEVLPVCTGYVWVVSWAELGNDFIHWRELFRMPLTGI